MAVGQRWTVVGVSVFTFFVCFAAFTAVRAGMFHLPTWVQSQMVTVGAVLLGGAAAYHVFRGGRVLDGWILAFGPSLAFTLNLFIPIHRGGVLSLLSYAVVSAAIGASILGVVGGAIGYLARMADART